MPGKAQDIKYETLLWLKSMIRVQKHMVIHEHKNLPSAAEMLVLSIFPQKL